jgi:hypothetical protein
MSKAGNRRCDDIPQAIHQQSHGIGAWAMLNFSKVQNFSALYVDVIVVSASSYIEHSLL